MLTRDRKSGESVARHLPTSRSYDETALDLMRHHGNALCIFYDLLRYALVRSVHDLLQDLGSSLQTVLRLFPRGIRPS